MVYRCLFLLLLFFSTSSFAQWDQLFPDSEDPALYDHVNVITGELNLSFQDTLVQGAKSLPINRSYTSAGALDSSNMATIQNLAHYGWTIRGGWSFLCHIDLLIELSERIKDFKFYIQEHNGNLVGYTFDHKRSDGRTYVYRPTKEILKNATVYNGRQNLHKNKLTFDKKTGKAVLHLPDGSYRVYEGRKFHSWRKSHFISFQKETRAKLYYKLTQEVLSSRHRISYTYNRYHDLTDVLLQNPAGTKTFASYHITAKDFDTPQYQLKINTSDQKTLTYKALNCKNVGYLCNVASAQRKEENTYLKERRGIGARLKQILFDKHIEVQVDYYCPPDRNTDKKWEEHPDKKPFEADKVRFLSTPTGPEGQFTRLAEFFYQPHLTDVRDVKYRLTRFHHDKGKITAIEYFDGADQLYSVLRFGWKGNSLMSKTMLDPHGNPFLSKTFAYDSAGNIIQETLWGNFTGNASVMHLNADGSLSGGDHYTKSYTYLPHFNLPIVEEEEGGLTYLYNYLQDTDLITAKFSCSQGQILLREFTFYDADHLPIKEIRDNGRSTDPNDVQVTFRTIDQHERDPHTGLITTTKELYFDPSTGKEQLIRKTSYTYSLQHQIISESIYDSEDQYRYTLYSEYDPKGNLISKTTPLGQKNTYTYDARGRLESVKEVGSLLKRYLYDPAGRPAAIEEWDSEGLVKKTYTQYDSAGTLLSQTDEKGNTTYQTYDAFRRSLSTRFPACLDTDGSSYEPEVRFSYDLQGNLISTTVRDASTSSTRYTPLRKPLEETHPDGTQTTHRYHPNGTLHMTTYADGTTIEYEYDPFENQTSKKIFSLDGDLLSEESWQYNPLHLTSYTDPNGLVTYYTYDASGRLTCEQQEGRCIQIGYDSLGFEASITKADVTQRRLYDAGGRIVEEWLETSDHPIENHMRFHYDLEDRKISAERETACGWVCDSFCYDRESRLCSHTDPEGNLTEFLYDHDHVNLLGQHVLSKKTIDPTGNVQVEIFDTQDRLVSTEKKDRLGQSVAKEERIYDRMGNCAKRVSTLYHRNTPRSSTHVSWEYDLMGRILTQIESDQKVTAFTYDSRGREIQRILPNGVSLLSSYDGIGRLKSLTSSDNSIDYQYHYSTYLEPITIYDHVRNWELNRTYNIFGELTHEQSPCNQRYQWDYDALGRCTQFTLTDGSSVAYTYQNHHLREVCRLSAHNELLYTHHYLSYDVNGYVSQEQLILQGGRQTTQRDRMERPIQKHSDGCTETRKYNQLSLVNQTGHSLCGNKTYSYDPLNQLIQEGKATYAFDSLGNPLSCAVNALNQIIESPDETYQYDLNGNLIQKLSANGKTTYTYDALNRLTSITHSDGQYTTYLYDPLSRLIAEETKEKQHFYLYDHFEEVGSADAEGNIVQFKVLGLGIKGEIGAAVAIELENVPYIPLNDLNGNIIGLIDADNNLVESYTIDAFGKETLKTTPINPWRFCSKRNTDALYLFGKRFYDPQLGRWLTPDPSGFSDGMNLYVYVLNSPLNRLDLFGLDSDFSFQNNVRIEMSTRHLSTARENRMPTILPCQVLVDGALSQWMVSCGHWHKLQFTPEEVKTGKVNIVDHFHELLPNEGANIGLITDLNGIQVKLSDVKKNMEFLTQAIPEGTLTFAMHTQTKGFISDIKRTFQERKGKETEEVIRGRQFLGAMLEVIDKINPQMFLLHIAHSRGGATSNAIFKGMTEDQKAQLQNKMFYLGVGPAKPLMNKVGYDVSNTYSRQDAITGWFSIPHIKDSRYDIRFVKCRSRLKERTAYFADHARLGRTYKMAQNEHFDEFRLKTRFYNGQVP